MSDTNARRRRLFGANPHCFWCGRLTFLTQNQGDSASADHLYSKFHPLRAERRSKCVLACRTCNGERSQAEMRGQIFIPKLEARAALAAELSMAVLMERLERRLRRQALVSKVQQSTVSDPGTLTKGVMYPGTGNGRMMVTVSFDVHGLSLEDVGSLWRLINEMKDLYGRSGRNVRARVTVGGRPLKLPQLLKWKFQCIIRPFLRTMGLSTRKQRRAQPRKPCIKQLPVETPMPQKLRRIIAGKCRDLAVVDVNSVTLQQVQKNLDDLTEIEAIRVIAYLETLEQDVNRNGSQAA